MRHCSPYKPLSYKTNRLSKTHDSVIIIFRPNKPVPSKSQSHFNTHNKPAQYKINSKQLRPPYCKPQFASNLKADQHNQTVKYLDRHKSSHYKKPELRIIKPTHPVTVSPVRSSAFPNNSCISRQVLEQLQNKSNPNKSMYTKSHIIEHPSINLDSLHTIDIAHPISQKRQKESTKLEPSKSIEISSYKPAQYLLTQNSPAPFALQTTESFNSKSRTRQKLTLSSKSAQPVQRFECLISSRNNNKSTTFSTNRRLITGDQQDNRPWFSPLKQIISRLFVPQQQDGCNCQSLVSFKSQCPWAVEFVNWGNSQRVRDQGYYSRFRLISPNAETVQQIQKDLGRTHPNITMFKNPVYRNMLRCLLQSYSKYDTEVGYCQGMNLIAAGLLFHIKQQEPAFWVFVKIMDKLNARSLFIRNFQYAQHHVATIDALIVRKMADLHNHLMTHSIDLKIFCFPWVISLLTTIVSVDYVHLLFAGLMQEGWPFLHEVVLAYLEYLKPSLLEAGDPCDLLMLLSVSHANKTPVPWGQIIDNI